MDLEFIQAAQASPEVRHMVRRLSDAEDLERTASARQALLSDLSLFWAAIADAAGPTAEQPSPEKRALLEIARNGMEACGRAARGDGPLKACRAHLNAFLIVQTEPTF